MSISDFSMWDRMRAMSDGGSAYDQLAQRIQSAAQPTSYQPAPAVNPNSLINPYYMQAQPMDSLAPMSMYQNYKQTGQMPSQTNSFQPMGNMGMSGNGTVFGSGGIAAPSGTAGSK